MHQPGGTLHKESRIHAVHPHRLTLKALANVSPGPGSPGGQPARGGSVALWQPWVQKRLQKDSCESADGDATPSGLRLCEMMALSPGLPEQPWAEVCERFQRYPFR